MSNIAKIVKDIPFQDGSVVKMSAFFESYYKVIEELSVGESMRVVGFENRDRLKEFAQMMIWGEFPDRAHNYQISEKDLAYTIERVL